MQFLREGRGAGVVIESDVAENVVVENPHLDQGHHGQDHQHKVERNVERRDPIWQPGNQPLKLTIDQ